MKPWSKQELRSSGVIERLLVRSNKANVPVELNNLLASVDSLSNLEESEIVRIEKRYKVKLSLDFLEERCQLYTDLLKEYLSDRLLSEVEVERLAHLKRLLRLSDAHITVAHEEAAGAVYSESIREAMSDGQISEEEREFLAKLESSLCLPKDVANRIHEETGGELVKTFFNRMIADQRISPEEEEEFEKLQRNLGIKAEYDNRTLQVLRKYRLFWQIENGTIPSVEVDINLGKTEKCYFVCNCDWYELRKRLKRIRYGGPALRIKIIKGVYWRAGDYAVGGDVSEELRHIDTGRVYLTDKRVIFRGSRGNKTIGISKILDFDVYRDGIQLQKDTGKNPTMKLEGDPEVFAMILGRLFSEV